MTPSEEQREKLRWFLSSEEGDRHPTMGGLDEASEAPAAPKKICLLYTSDAADDYSV